MCYMIVIDHVCIIYLYLTSFFDSIYIWISFAYIYMSYVYLSLCMYIPLFCCLFPFWPFQPLQILQAWVQLTRYDYSTADNRPFRFEIRLTWIDWHEVETIHIQHPHNYCTCVTCAYGIGIAMKEPWRKQFWCTPSAYNAVKASHARASIIFKCMFSFSSDIQLTCASHGWKHAPVTLVANGPQSDNHMQGLWKSLKSRCIIFEWHRMTLDIIDLLDLLDAFGMKLFTKLWYRYMWHLSEFSRNWGTPLASDPTRVYLRDLDCSAASRKCLGHGRPAPSAWPAAFPAAWPQELAKRQAWGLGPVKKRFTKGYLDG